MAIDFLTMRDIDLQGKRLLIREDFNVPIVDGKITNISRIKAALPTIRFALEHARQACLMSHLGRPKGVDPKYTLLPVAQILQELLGMQVYFSSTLEQSSAPIVMYENVRFLAGETANDLMLAKQMATLCDVFVLDAFGSAHRAHASTVGVASQAPLAVAGLLLTSEIEQLNRIMQDPQRPLVAVIGGAKISSKMQVLSRLLPIVDKLIIGGGMANTFLAAKGVDIKNSLFEADMLDFARQILDSDIDKKVILPTDMVWQVDKIMDIGSQSCIDFARYINNAKTIVWNGPMGVFEESQYATGTIEIAKSIAASHAYKVAGGGDTLAALDLANVENGMDYISTGGGAFLEYIEKGALPAIQVLARKI